MGNKGLESSLQELVGCKSKNIIELLLLIGKETELYDSSDKGITLENSSWILRVKGHELSCSLSKFCQCKLYSPDLSLVLKSVLTDKSKLTHKSFLIEGLSWGLRSFLIISV